MSEFAEIIKTLESNIEKLFSKIATLEKNNTILNREITDSAETIKNQSLEIELFKSQYNSIKMANSLLGSEENKRETKLKINSLIREIDHCIAQLSD
jgi:chromosome segregation ATPase